MLEERIAVTLILAIGLFYLWKKNDLMPIILAVCIFLPYYFMKWFM